MSAPHEIIVHNGRAFSDLNTHGMTDGFINTVQKVGVRYLRADLTCGECEKEGKPECLWFVDGDDECEWPSGLHPACMAFVPRKETP